MDVYLYRAFLRSNQRVLLNSKREHIIKQNIESRLNNQPIRRRNSNKDLVSISGQHKAFQIKMLDLYFKNTQRSWSVIMIKGGNSCINSLSEICHCVVDGTFLPNPGSLMLSHWFSASQIHLLLILNELNKDILGNAILS